MFCVVGWRLGNKGIVPVCRGLLHGHLSFLRPNIPVFNCVARQCGRLCTDDAKDPGEAGNDKDKEDRQGVGWGSFFGGVGQGGRSGGMSPTRSTEVKKAIRAAMAFGLPKRGGGGAGRLSGGPSSAGKDGGVGIEDDRSGNGKGIIGLSIAGVGARKTRMYQKNQAVRCNCSRYPTGYGSVSSF